MLTKVKNWLWNKIVDWLNGIPESNRQPLAINNTDHLLRDIRPADVILFEGRSRVSEVIKMITTSPWTHAAIYIGRLVDIKEDGLKRKIRAFYDGDETTPLIIESLLGKGTIVSSLNSYPDDNLRVCRPSELNFHDQNKVISFAIEHLGMLYDVRQLLDLARFMFPYAILPKEWRSSLFQHNAGKPTHIVCSGMITRCFQSVNYPILPTIKTDKHDEMIFFKRNFRLFVPADFDYSPYFEIIKFPVWGSSRNPKGTVYEDLPWREETHEELVESTETLRSTPGRFFSLKHIILKASTIDADAIRSKTVNPDEIATSVKSTSKQADFSDPAERSTP